MPIGSKDTVFPIGKTIQGDREARKLSQDALAGATGYSVSERTIRRAEKGERISRESLGYIAKALGFLPERYIKPSRKTAEVAGRHCENCNAPAASLKMVEGHTKAGEGTFTRHFQTYQCLSCGALFRR